MFYPLLSLPRGGASSLLMQMAGVLLCFSLSLNVFCVYYNYLDFRYHWNALDISFFFSALGVLLALTSGVMIRFLVPKRLSMERGVLIGLSLQVRFHLYRILGPCCMPSPVRMLGVGRGEKA